MLPIIKTRNWRPLRTRSPWSSLEGLLDDLWPNLPSAMTGVNNLGNIDLHEDDKHLYLTVELPGFQRDQIEVVLEDGVLHLQAERSEDRQNDDDHYYLRERSFGKWGRSIRLPVAVQQEKIDAGFTDGVLKITLEKRDQKRSRKIEIK